jgi:allantoin racemase
MVTQSKYRFCLIDAFRLSDESTAMPNNRPGLRKEQRLMNYDRVKHLLKDVEWDLNRGPQAPYGDWLVENREEFSMVAAAKLPIIREICESGKYNAIVLLGGGEPGFPECREIARKYKMPVTSCAFSQMHIATMLGNKFSVIDLAESHDMYYYTLVIQHHMKDRCGSIRCINYPLPRPGCEGSGMGLEREKANRGERSEPVERAVTEAVAAIQEDGAEVITFGCSGSFWLQPYVETRLHDMGWEVPVLEGYSCAITLAKVMVDLGLDASGLMFPSDRPKQYRRKKVF